MSTLFAVFIGIGLSIARGAAAVVILISGKILQEDGTSGILLEDGVSYLILEG